MESSFNDSQKLNDYLDNFRNIFYAYAKLTNEEWNLLKNLIIFKSAKKNSKLLSPSQSEQHARFLVKGAIKVKIHTQSPYIFDFREEGDFLCDVNSLISQNKSTFTFSTITDCEWFEFDGKDLLNLMQFNDGVLTAIAKITMIYLEQGHERNTFLRIKSAEDRYHLFCKAHRQIIKYAKLKDIASYLDLAQQTLSRIRKNNTNRIS